jgi:hypothetical protein
MEPDKFDLKRPESTLPDDFMPKSGSDYILLASKSSIKTPDGSGFALLRTFFTIFFETGLTT